MPRTLLNGTRGGERELIPKIASPVERYAGQTSLGIVKDGGMMYKGPVDEGDS